jgi:hypothetical protein
LTRCSPSPLPAAGSRSVRGGCSGCRRRSTPRRAEPWWESSRSDRDWWTFHVTAILYLGLLATFAIVDGALDIGEGLSLDHELGHRSGWRSLAVSGTAAMATGVIMFVADPGPDPLRVMLVFLSAAHGAAGLFSARHVSTLTQ